MHEHFMLAALKQAWLGRGQCAPNPAVGAVAVRNHAIIAQAFHSGAGSLHAERKLLESLSTDCTDLTIYVTLEPCNHWGKTPPCLDILIEKRIKRVVYGYADPNPVVSENKTPERLRQHGIDVLFYPMSEITKFYRSYHHWVSTKRPWVTAKIAQTLDGKIAGAYGKRLQLSNAECSVFTHENRQHTDVILTTAKTVNQDNPLLNARLPDGREISKTVAILDRQGILRGDAHLYKTASRCLIYHGEQHTPPPFLSTIETYQLPKTDRGLDLDALLIHLGGLGFHDVWVEAGAELFCALHHQNLVQTTHIYLVPRILPDGLSLYNDVNFFQNPHQASCQALGDNMLATFEWS